MDSFSDFIEQQRQVGAVESAGSFTLAIDKARDKLGKHTLPSPEDFILKLVQCAVSARTDRLHFTFSRTSILCHFEVSQGCHSLSVDTLANALTNPLEERIPARSYLALALCALVNQEPVELMWGDWDGQDSNIILSLGHGRSELFRKVPFPRTEALPSGRRLHLLYIQKKSSSKLPLNLTGPEQQLLRERCSFSPVPIEVNAAPLLPHPPLQAYDADAMSQFTSLYFGGIKFIREDPNGFLWRCNPEEEPGPSSNRDGLKFILPHQPPALVVHKPSQWLLPLHQDVTFQELYVVPSLLYGPSLIYFAKDGVLLHPITVHDAGGGAAAVLSGVEVSTDLTGLQVVRDETVEQVISSAVEHWKGLVNEFVDERPPVYRSSRLSSSDDVIYFLFGCCLLAPFGHLVKGALDYFTGAERKREIQFKRFQRQLQSRRGYLAYFRSSREKPKKSSS